MHELIDLDGDAPCVPVPQIEVDVAVRSVDAAALFERAAFFVATEVMSRYEGKRSIEKRAAEIFAELLDKRLDAVLRNTVEEIVHKPIPKTDVFGNPVGEPTSIAQIVESAGQRFLTEVLDDNGKVVLSGYSHRTGKPRIEHMVSGIVLAGFEKEIKAEAENFREGLRSKAKEAVATLLADVRL